MALYLGKNRVSVKFGSKVIKSTDNKELKVLQNGTYTIDLDSEYTGFNPVKVAVPAVGSTITVKNLTGKAINANDKVWLNYYYKKGDTNFFVLDETSRSGYDLGMLFTNGINAFCKGGLYSIGNDSATKLTSFPSQIAYAPCTGFLKDTLYATSAFYGSASSTHNKWMIQSNGSYVTLGQYMTPLVSNSNSDGWAANYNNNYTCYLAHYNEKLEQDASFSINSSSIWSFPIYGTTEFIYNDISYSLNNKGKLKLDKENKTISSYSTYSPTNIQCQYPFGMTLDNKILICTSIDMHGYVATGDTHRTTKANLASIQFYELVEDKSTGELTTVRGYTSDEMPAILQTYFAGTDNKASWTWNRFSGVLAGVTDDSIIAIQYKDGKWISKEIILPNYTPKITDAISFNEDMSVAFVSGSVAKIYNIDDKEEWHAVSYSLANINEETVTGQAETNAEPDVEFPVTIADIGGSISPDPLTVTPSIEDATVLETQYDVYTSPFTDTQGQTYDSVSTVKVRKIGSWIDSHLSADNIRKDVSVLGVKGNIIELVPETITVSATTQEQTINPTTGNGFTEVKVNAITLQDKTVTPSNSQQIVRYDSNYTGLNSVTVKAVDATADSNIKAENIKENITILGVTGTFAGKKIDSYKTVTPTTSSQTIRPDEGYDGISYVNVNPVTYDIDSNIIAANIKKDVNILGITGTYEGVERVYKTLNVSPKITSQTLAPEEGVDGFNKVEVSAVTSDIDSNILPKNIKRGITILGVEGNYIPENLQSKVVNPTTAVQNVTYDDGYEGLNNVQVNAVTSAIDENIKAENIRQNISILGVTGTLEEGIKQAEIEPTKNIAPTKEPIIVTPDEGYKALSQVNIEGVSASIDANILAENIKKGIEILGVTGTLESQEKILQNKKEVEPSMIQQIITPDVGYDALLQVIVKAVTASIDPNILPENIKKNISILGVTGTLEEGQEQKWFDFSGISGVGTMNKNIDNGGTIATLMKLIDTNWELKKLFTDLIPDGKIPSNINAALFDLVYGYDDMTPTDNGLEQLFIFFTGGQLYTDYSKLTRIKDQIRWLYPYTNDIGVDGCLINYTDDGTEKVLKLYVLTDSTNVKQPVPVLVDGTMSASLLPEGFDGFRYVVDMTIPAHTIFDPKITSDKKLNWVLQARKGVKSLIHVNEDKPLTIDISAYDKNFGEDDEGKEKSYNFNQYNFTIQGTPALDDGIASNFSSSDYLDLGHFDFSGDYEIVLKFKMPETDSDASNYKPFFDAKSNVYFNITVTNYINGKRYIHSNSGDGSNWHTDITGTTPLELNTEYYVKVIRSGTTRTMYLSTDNETWTTEGSIEDTYNYSLEYTLGAESYASSQEVFNGSIDLTKCYIKVNNKLVWVPYSEYVTITSHTIYPLTKDLLFYKRNNSLGNLVNYVDNGDAVDIKLYHTISEDAKSSDLSYPFEFDSTIDTSKLIDGNNFIINSNLNAITSGPKSYHVNNGSSYGYFKIHTPNESTAFSVTAYVSSEGNYDFGGCYVGTEIYNADRSAITSSTTDGHGKWLFMNSNSSQETYTTTLDADTDYYIQFYYTKDGGGNINEDRIIIKNMKFSYYSKNELYVFAPDENLDSEYQNVEFIDNITIPTHNLYEYDNGEWKQLSLTNQEITVNADNAEITLEEIIE